MFDDHFTVRIQCRRTKEGGSLALELIGARGSCGRIYLPKKTLTAPSTIRRAIEFLNKARKETDPPASDMLLALLPEEMREKTLAKMEKMAVEALLCNHIDSRTWQKREDA